MTVFGLFVLSACSVYSPKTSQEIPEQVGVDKGIYDNFFKNATVPTTCNHRRVSPVSYLILVKKDGWPFSRQVVTTWPGCRIVVGFLSGIPYTGGQHMIPTPFGDTNFVTVGLQIALFPNASDPSKIRMVVREKDLMTILTKKDVSLPIVRKYEMAGSMTLKRGETTLFPKRLLTKGQDGHPHVYTIAVKEG